MLEIHPFSTGSHDYGREGLEEFCLKIHDLDVPLEVSFKRLGSAGFLQ